MICAMIVSVVKVNCSSFAFNIIKQNVVIEEHQKYQKIVEKGCKSVHRKICLLCASDDVIPGKHSSVD